MVDRARSEARERKAMRAEDKYTDETDPVESQERRMQRQMDAWREENKEDLKDDLKEKALRCLQAERDGKEPEKDIAPEVAAEDSPEVPPVQEEARAGDTDKPAAGEKKEVDNRKLVYEDIWDDLPSTSAPTAARAPVETKRPAFA